MKIAVFGNAYRHESIAQIKILFEALKERKAHVIADKSFFDFFHEKINEDGLIQEIIEDDNFSADLALSIGGDGTFLNTASRIGAKNIPILGINTGRLGFLADVSSNEILPAIDEIYNDKCFIEERSVIQLKTENTEFKSYPYALNEIAILKQDSSSMITINAHVNGEYLNTYQSDGLLIATPTGSTAYSMSVGGPLVVPQANNLIISPVAPHSLHIRPLVIPDTWTIELEVKSRNKNFLVSLDGRSDIFEQHHKLSISKGEFTIKVVKRPHHTFFNALRTKLMWGADKRI